MSGETTNPQPDPDLYLEQLVAYLDGELPSEARQALEHRLSEDADLRQQLHDHQQAWDLLDDIPRVEVQETFVKTTVEMVAISTEKDVQDIQHRQNVKRKYTWFAGAAGALLAGAIGYFGMSSYLAAPDQQLVDDLPIIENLDAYRNAESVEFLKALEEEGLFVAEVDDVL